MSDVHFSRISIVIAVSLLLTALPTPRASAQAVNYSGHTRVLNVGKLIINSGVYDSAGPLAGVPEDTAPHLFYLLDQRTDLKPRGWILQNPLAPSTVTQAIHDRWVKSGGNPKGIDPLVSHGLRYQVGSAVSKDMAAYWEVNLVQTPLKDLLKFDMLFISSHTDGESFSPQEQEKLRKLVEAGGVVWLDDCWKFRIADSGRFFLPNLQFHGSHIGAAAPASSALAVDPTHPLITTPFFLTQDDLDHLGDKNVGEYYHTGFVAPQPITGTFNDPTPKTAPDLSQPEADVLAPVLMNTLTADTTKYPGGPYPYLSAGRYGAGFVIVSSGDIGDAINANCGGTTGYNIPAPDYDKNGGSVCGNSLLASDSEDLKFAYNALSWASNFSTYRRGPEHSAYSPQTVTLPITKQWNFLLNQGEAVESDPIVVRNNIFVATSTGRLICLMKDPTQVPGAVGPVEIWEANPGNGTPLSSMTTVIAGSTELIVVSAGAQMVAYNAAYGSGNVSPPSPLPPSNTPWLPTPNVAWTFNIPGGNDSVNGAPVSMDGSLFITTQHGAVWEVDPGTGQPQRSTAKLPADPNNPSDVLPPTEPILHYADLTKWSYIAATPAVGWVVDRSTSDDDPTLVLAVYTTATQFANPAAEIAADGALLQFPVKVANEHYLLGDPGGRQLATGGSWLLPPLKYNAIKNPELATFDPNTGVATPVTVGAGSGTMHLTIQWPDGTTAPSYYALAGGGTMAADYSGTNDPGPGNWVFMASGQKIAGRNLYNRIVLGAMQYHPGTGAQALTPDCSVHLDYDVDEGDPFGVSSPTSGPSFHPELATYDIRQINQTPTGPAVLGAPTIGLDDSVYFGDERGVVYSLSYYTRYGAHLLSPNWKYYTNQLHWMTATGASVNPVTLTDNQNNYTTDIHTSDLDNNVVRSSPTVGNGKLFVTVTDLAANRSRVLAFDPYESQQSNGSLAAGQGGATVTFQLAPQDPSLISTSPASARNPVQPVSMLAQFDPVTGIMHQYFTPRDFTVDPDSQKVTLLNFGQMYSDLPIYVYYNMANGATHLFSNNPPSPPDETHNVFPGVNGLPYDPTDKYFFPAPNSSYMGNPFYNAGVPTRLTDPNPYPHPYYRFPADKIGNLLWQFPDPVWNNPNVKWNAGLVFPTWNPAGVNWYGPTSGGNALIQPYAGASLGSAPLNTISDSSPLLSADSLVLGVSNFLAPGGDPKGTRGMMVLQADPRKTLAAYTDPEGAAIYDYWAKEPATPGSFPSGMTINDPGGVVTAGNSTVSAMNGSILAPYPPAATFYDAADFAGYSGMISTPALTESGAVVGSGLKTIGTGAVTLLGSSQTIALDSYRLVGLDPGGNVTFEIPSTTKTTFIGADEPTDEGSSLQDTGQFQTETLNFNRPSSMQKVDQSNLLIADSGNNRVVETDLGGTVVSEITRYYDPNATYQPGDFYTVGGGATPTYSIGNGHLSNPTDAYQWSTTLGNVSYNYRLVVDADNFQIVVIADEVYASGANKGQFVPLPQQIQGPNNTPVTLVYYHIKVWGSTPSPTGAQYRFRTAYPVLNTIGNAQFLSAVVATVSNTAFTLKTPANLGATPPQPAVWTENNGASIVILAGMNSPVPGTIQAAANGFTDLRSDKFGNGHGIQNPTFLRPYQDPNGNTHWLFIDQGAFYTPVQTPNGNGSYTLTFNDTRHGNFGVYDLPLTTTPDQITGNFGLTADGSLDSVDYADMTTNMGNNPLDLYYSPTQPPAFAPSSVQYLPLTKGLLVSNGALNLLTDPTLLINPLTDPKRLLGNGGEVLLIGPNTSQFCPSGPNGGKPVPAYNPFFHGPVPADSGGAPCSLSPDYWPDYTLSPSIQFRSIPVHGSYLLQQVNAATR